MMAPSPKNRASPEKVILGLQKILLSGPPPTLPLPRPTYLV